MQKTDYSNCTTQLPGGMEIWGRAETWLISRLCASFFEEQGDNAGFSRLASVNHGFRVWGWRWLAAASGRPGQLRISRFCLPQPGAIIGHC